MQQPTSPPRAAATAAKALPRAVIVLGIVSFFADVSSEIAYPLIPLFLTGVLRTPIAAVGLIEGVAESTASLLKVASGWWSDRIGRRMPLVVAGYALAALGKVLLAFAGSWPMVFGARFVDRFGKGVRGAPRDALLADVTEPDQRGRAFGLHRAMDTAGAVVGPLLALALVALFDDRLRLVFLVAAVPGVLAVVALAFVHEPARTPPARPAAPPPTADSTAAPAAVRSRLDRRLVLFFAATLVFALGNSSDVFILLRAKDLGLSTTLVVLVYVVYNFVYMSAAYPIGTLSDRIGRRGIFVAGLLTFATVYLGLALVREAWLVWPLFAMYGLYMAATDGVGKALISDLAPADRRGAVLGLYGTITGVSTLGASLAAGLLWDFVGVPAPFLLGAFGALAAAVLLLVGGRNAASVGLASR